MSIEKLRKALSAAKSKLDQKVGEHNASMTDLRKDHGIKDRAGLDIAIRKVTREAQAAKDALETAWQEFEEQHPAIAAEVGGPDFGDSP